MICIISNSVRDIRYVMLECKLKAHSVGCNSSGGVHSNAVLGMFGGRCWCWTERSC